MSTLEQRMAALIAAEEARKTSVGKSPNSLPSSPNVIQENQQPSLLDTVNQPLGSADDPNIVQQTLGRGLWSFLDEASLGTLGLAEEYDWFGAGDEIGVAKDFLTGTRVNPFTGEEEDIGPVSTTEKASSAVGTVGGFIAGAPMKGVKLIKGGIGAATRRLTGGQSTKQLLKKAGKEADDVAGELIEDAGYQKLVTGISSSIGASTAMATKVGKLNKSVNYVEHVQKGILQTADDYVAAGVVNRQLADDVANAYIKYVKDRPINTLTDYITRSIPDSKLAYTAGAMIEEALMFGILDGVREGIHVAGSKGKHEYDWTHPMWGGIMGLSFGSLKILPSAGKASLGKNDFMSGLRATISNGTKTIGKASYGELKIMARMMGQDAKSLGLNVVDDITVAGQKFKFDLSNVDSEIARIMDASGLAADLITESTKAGLLRQVLSKEANKYGKELIKWSSKNSFESLKENWMKMLLGGLAMNGRSIYDLTQGHNVGWDDISINMLIGGWLNRRGAPRVTDMFPERLGRLRRGLNDLGLFPKEYVATNPLSRIPSLDPYIDTNMNPFASDRSLNEIVKFAEKQGLTTNNFDSIDGINLKRKGDGTADAVGGTIKSVKQSSEDLSLFHRFHRFLQGAATKKYVRSLDNISEADALTIQKEIIKKFGNINQFTEHITRAAQQAGDRFEAELTGTAVDVLKLLGVRVGDKSEGSIGNVPDLIVVDDVFFKDANNGSLKSRIPAFEGIKNEPKALSELVSKLNTILQSTIILGKANPRNVDKAVFVRDPAVLESLYRTVVGREISINEQLGLSKTSSNSFSFSNVESMMYYMTRRVTNRRISEFSKLLDRDFEDGRDVLSALIDAGLIKSGDKIGTDLRLVDNINQITITKNGKPLKDPGLISDNKLLLSSVLEVLNAKGQYGTTSEPITVDVSQINNLSSFLNRKGVNTDPQTLANFSTLAVQNITFKNFERSGLNASDINVFEAFYRVGSPDLLNKFSLMKYKRPGVGRKAVGIEVHKLNYEGSDVEVIDIVKRYNEYVDGMVKRGAVEGSKESFVTEGDVYTLTNRNSFFTVQSIMQDAIFTSNKTAQSELSQYLVKTIGKDSTRDAALTFLSAYPEHASKLNKLLINVGAIELKPGEANNKNIYEYKINQEKWSDPTNQQRINDFISKFGVNMETLDTMVNRASKDLETYLEEMYQPGDHKGSITESQFFQTYLPNVQPKADVMRDHINNRIFNEFGEFRGYKSINELYNEMVIKPGTEVEAWGHLTQILSNKLQSTTKKVFYYADGDIRVKDTNLHSYKTPYFNMLDKMGLKYGLVEGTTMDWVHHPEFDRIMYQPLDIFQDKATVVNKAERQMIADRKNHFLKLLKGHGKNEGFDQGMELIEMPGLKLSLVVSAADAPKIKQAYMELYNRQSKKAIDNTLAKDKLDAFKEQVELSEGFDAVIHQAMRELILESMVGGKNKDLYLDALTWSKENIDKYYTSRMTMFNTMKFKRIDPELLKAQVVSYDTVTRLGAKNLDLDGVYAARKFLTKNKYGVGVFDDAGASFDMIRTFEAQNPGLKWVDYYGSRKTESNVDSITFISKNMADFLAFHYGVPGSKVFKPIISSQGEGNLMYGKTAFVYDPKLDGVFKRNPNLDVLMASSADKLKLYKTDAEMINVPKDQFSMIGKIEPGKITELPLNSLGVQKIPDHYTPAKISPGVINNHTDFDIAQKIYGDYYGPDLVRNIKNVTEMLENPFIEQQLIKELKKGQAAGKLEDLELLDNATMHTSMHMEWLNLSEYASIDVFGSNAKMTPIKAQFIDKVMAPKSEFYDGNGILRRYGAKSTISQHMGIDLKGTLFNPKTGKIERYGEIMLPDDVGMESISFGKKPFDVRVVNTKTNEIRTAKEVFMELMPKGTAKELLWSKIESHTEPLKELFRQFESGFLKDYDIVISTMRYPRTRPNDLMFLRLKGFVDPRSGNQAIVNSFDVFNIFEGDYDIDAVDYFWAGSKAFTDNIIRQQKVFVPTADVSNAKEVLPDVEFSPRNVRATNNAWGELFSNKRAMANIRGLVQATSALVKHVDNIAAVQADGRKVLLRNPNVKKGQEGYWEVEMDWNNADFHLRQALEGQILLDATNPDPAMLNTVRRWRYDMLFPEYSSGKTLSKDDFYSVDRNGVKTYYPDRLAGFINGKKDNSNEYADYRVRLFRRFEYEMVDGVLTKVEKDLRAIDKKEIQTIMRQYSQLLEVTPGRKVHTGGTSKTASYDDMLSRSQKYFTYANNFVDKLFKSTYYSQEYDPMTEKTNYIYQGNPAIKVNAKDMQEYYNPKPREYVDSKGNRQQAKFLVDPTTNPFPRAVVENFRKIARGESGGIVERMLHTIYDMDPLNALSSDTKVLTNRGYRQEQQLAYELLNNPDFDVSRMTDIMPKLLYNVKKDVSTLNSLKYDAARLAKNRYMKNKVSKLRALNQEIYKLEQKLNGLMTAEYKKTRRTKDLAKFDIVEIQNDRDVINGTVHYYTLSHLVKSFQPTNPGKMKEDLIALRTFIGKNYGNLTELHGLGYRRKSMYTAETRESLSNTKTSKQIELTAEEMLTKGVNEHGITFLLNFAMPSTSAIQNKVGVFNGNVMPIAAYGSGNYSRAIRWLLKARSRRLPGANDAMDLTQIDNLLRHWAEIDFTWRRFFSGRSKHLPLDVTEMNKLLSYGAPKFDWKMNKMFSNYTDIQINKPVDEFNPFGMGRRYDMQMQFYRSLANADRGVKAIDFGEGLDILSYTNQLMMENGYMTPTKHLALMGDVTQRLGSISKKVFPSQVDVNTGEVKQLRPFDMLNNPIYAMLGSGYGKFGSGLSLDPWNAMSQYNQISAKKMMNQVIDMKNAKQNEWRNSYFEKDVRQDINKKAEDC